VATEDGLVEGGERLEVFWSRKLGQKRIGVDVEPVLPDSWREVKIQTAIEAFLDELAITRNLAQRVEFGRQVLLFSLLGILVLPGFLFLLGRQVLGWWVVAKVVSRRSELGSWDVHNMGVLRLFICPYIVVRLFLLFLFSLSLLGRLVW
jgi:hypothetical protein